MQKTTINERENNFNIIQFVAAIMVIYGHMFVMLGAVPKLVVGQAISTIGVKIIFMISGYLIAKSFMRDNNLIRYGIRRLFRIIPGLAGVVLFSVVIVGPICTNLGIKEYFLHPMTRGYLKNIIFQIQYFLPGVFEKNIYPNAVNGSLWSLPAQMLMYIALPIIFLVFKKLDKASVGLVLAIAAELAHVIVGKIWPGAQWVVFGLDLRATLTLAPYFFIGIAYTSTKIKEHLNLQWASAVWILIMILDVSSTKSELLVFLGLPYFIFSLAFAPNPVFQKCFSKNDYSYGMYLYGFLVQQVLVHFLMKYNLTLNVYALMATIGAFGLSVLSWYCIEKPFQKLSKKLVSKVH